MRRGPSPGDVTANPGRETEIGSGARRSADTAFGERTETGDEDPRGDARVVRDVLDGDREAYRVLVRRYEDALYRHAAGMVGPADAEDVVQRALVRGFRRLDDCREPERVGGWLFRITSNLCKDLLRGRSRDAVALEDAGPLESETGGPEEALDRSELGREIDEALSRLTPDQREAFLLKHVEGLSYPEMSERLSASVSALKMRVHRARETLQELLERHASDYVDDDDG